MNFNFRDNFAHDISKLCFDQFKRLPKRGKPQNNKEWTLLAAVVASFDSQSNSTPHLKVLTLCTGTKCLGKSFLSKKGDVVSDCHAEVLARRAFKRYILHEMNNLLKGVNSEIIEQDKTSCFHVKPHVKFHFFTTHTPCGDASIIPKHVKIHSGKRSLDNNPLDGLSCKRFKNDENQELESLSTDRSAFSSADDCKSLSIITDIFRTGAKCVINGKQDSKGTGLNYHVVGALRTKPGRGDPSLSMSCSDKMALWNVCGIQGSLISLLLPKPIYLSSVTIGKCPFDESSIHRAIVSRTAEVKNLPDGYSLSRPQIFQSNHAFEYNKELLQQDNNKKMVPCSAAIIWCNILNESADVCVNGKRQGITKKNRNKLSSYVNVCRRNIFQEFLEVIKRIPEHQMPKTICVLSTIRSTYFEYKEAALAYRQAKKDVYQVLSGWTTKPAELQMFTINSE